jgi:hypothetical protein
MSRKLKLKFVGLADVDYAKKITRLSVTHIGWKFEIDRMACWTQGEISYRINIMNEYYETHAYHTVYYYFSTVLSDDAETYQSEHWNYYDDYYYHKGQEKWEYTIWVKNCVIPGIPYPIPVVGWHYTPYLLIDVGIAISYKFDYFMRAIWHEYGHHIWINIPETGYCPNDDCVMSQQWDAYYYCFHHWLQRQTM